MIESVSACGWPCTADSTATRGRVTRRATPRNMRSKLEVVRTLRSLALFLEWIKYLVSALDLLFGRESTHRSCHGDRRYGIHNARGTGNVARYRGHQAGNHTGP